MTEPNPYIGPRTFAREQKHLFFGREREARELLSLVISERLVMFYAQSGAGKSSLINTRLLPGLEAEGFAVLPVGRVSGELPEGVSQVDNIYAFNLMLSLDQHESNPQQLSHLTLTEFLAKLTSNDGQHYFYDHHAPISSSAVDEGTPYVLIIDQFEELITTHNDCWPNRAAFFKQLNAAMLADPMLWVVLSLREDYVAVLDPYAPLLEEKLRSRFYMQRMGYQAALTAIQRPAELGQRPYGAGVAERLVDNLRQIKVPGQKTAILGQFIEPVQLQVVCYQLWQALHQPGGNVKPGSVITDQDLAELGDVDKALSQFYEEALRTVLHQLDLTELTVRNWFNQQLITAAGTRGLVYQNEQDTGGLPNEAIRLLEGQFLIRAENRAGGTWYELVHDRFIEPILQANRRWHDDRLEQSALVRAAQAWLDAGKPARLLLRGDYLREAVAEANTQTQEPFVTSYLKASQQAQQQRALKAATAKLQQQRLVGAGLLLVLLITLGLAIYAFLQRGQAIAHANAAATAEAVAVDKAQAALTAQAAADIYRATAEAASTQAIEQRDLAETAAAEAVTSQNQAIGYRDNAYTREAEAVMVRETVAIERDDLLTKLGNQEATLIAQLTLQPTETSYDATGTRLPFDVDALETQLIQLQQFKDSLNHPLFEATATATPLTIDNLPAARIGFISNRYSTDLRFGQLFIMQSNGANQTKLIDALAAEPHYSTVREQFIFSRPNPPPNGRVSLVRFDRATEQEYQYHDRWDDWEPAFSPDGQKIAFVSSRENRDWEIYVMNHDGTAVTWLSCTNIDPDWLKWGPAWSPDGQQIAFVVQSEGRGQYQGVADIWLMAADGSNCYPLTNNASNSNQAVIDKYPDWSSRPPHTLVFVSNRSGQFELYSMNPDGTALQKLPNSPQQANYPAWSPNGQWLVFSASTTPDDVTSDDIFIMTHEGYHLTNLTSGHSLGKNWYPIWVVE